MLSLPIISSECREAPGTAKPGSLIVSYVRDIAMTERAFSWSRHHKAQFFLGFRS
jgi:hypothetical protein